MEIFLRIIFGAIIGLGFSVVMMFDAQAMLLNIFVGVVGAAILAAG